MNLSEPSYADRKKWQQMLAIVSQHRALTLNNPKRGTLQLYLRRLFTENILIILLQYTGLAISMLASPNSPAWLASGTACAFIFLRGTSITPGIWLGTFFAYYSANTSAGLAIVIATLFALQAVSLVWISIRYINPILIFYHRWPLVKFILCTSVVTALISLGVVLLSHAALTINLWLQSWLANLNGILVLAFALTVWDAYFPELESFKKLNLYFVGIIYGILLAVIIAYLGNFLSFIGFAAITLSLIVLISKCYSWCGVVNAIFLLGIVLTLAAFIGAPLFANHFSMQSLILLESSLAITALSGLFLSVTIQPFQQT